MSELFNADEIFEIAEKVEINGEKFYRAAAENSNAAQCRDILLELADAEVLHYKTFAAMREEIRKEGMILTIDPDFDPDGEASLYLQAIANGNIFDVRQNLAESLTGEESAEEILQTALGREKDAVIFYLGMKDMVSEKLGKSKIDGIIKEEMSHVTIISREIKKLS